MASASRALLGSASRERKSQPICNLKTHCFTICDGPSENKASYFRDILGLPHIPATFLELSRDYPATFPKLSRNFPKTILQLSLRYPESVPQNSFYFSLFPRKTLGFLPSKCFAGKKRKRERKQGICGILSWLYFCVGRHIYTCLK